MNNKPLILVVEDDAAVRSLMAVTLDTQGYRYHLAGNGGAALIEASTQQPAVMLLDLGLPDMEGVDIIRKVRGWTGMPIIVISARSEDADKVEALDAGADDYLTKPFAMEELHARLRALYRRKREYKVRTLSFGNLELDTEASELRAHNTIGLALKEVRLLSCLLSNADQALTAGQLLNEVWPGEGASEEVVWMYVSFLNAKLQSVRANVTIDGDRNTPYRVRMI
jgi:two-component system KDP operon response regulator KdpE